MPEDPGGVHSNEWIGQCLPDSESSDCNSASLGHRVRGFHSLSIYGMSRVDTSYLYTPT